MSCCEDTPFLDLGCVYQNDTWGGFSVSITSPSTFFSGNLDGVRMRFKDADGTSQLLLTDSDGITIETATANAWTFRVDERKFTMTPGDYTFGVELTDDSATPVVATWIVGAITIKTDPV